MMFLDGSRTEQFLVNQTIRKRILFQVIYPALLIGVVIECLLIPTRAGWGWSYKDSLAAGLFLFAMTLFIVFRRQAYAQRTPWLLLFFWFAAASSLFLFRRWGIIAIGCIGFLLLLTLVMRSKVLSEGISREGVFKILVLAGSSFLALVLTEAILRLFLSRLPIEVQQIVRADPSDYGVFHPYIGNLDKPNNALVLEGRDFYAVHHTDAYGFRNSWPWPKTADIVTLGDSVVFGQGVQDEQAWPAILAHSFPKSRVINLGLIGGGPQQYLRVYETFGLKLRPKLVLVGFFMGNDFWDAETFDLWLKSGTESNYMVWRDFGRPTNVSLELNQPIGKLLNSVWWRANLLARKSYLWNLLLYVGGNVRHWTPTGRKVFKAPDGKRLELAPGALANDAKEAQPGHYRFQLVVDTLQRIQSLAKENDASVLVILQRSKGEVYLPLLGEAVPDAAIPLRTELEKRGIAYLDLLQEFRRRAAEGEVLYFETDGHPNARGYALIAELVISHLKQHAKEFNL
jgi:lysophospholipase L1-like esterase